MENEDNITATHKTVISPGNTGTFAENYSEDSRLDNISTSEEVKIMPGACVVSKAPKSLPSTPLSSMLNFIERCVVDPNINVDKMNQLFDIQERMFNKQAEIEYNIAFSEMQSELPPIPITKKGQSGFHFTKATANKIINPILKEYGFALNFKTTQDGNFICVRATLRHRAGFSEYTEIKLPADVGGNKTSVQAIGSSQSYGERYTMKAILNLTILDDPTDDDAEAAQKKKESFQEKVRNDVKKSKSNAKPFVSEVEPGQEHVSTPKENTSQQSPIKETHELSWDKLTIHLPQNINITRKFISSEEAGGVLLKHLTEFETKKARIEVVNMNMPLIRALIKKGSSELIAKIHACSDAGK